MAGLVGAVDTSGGASVLPDIHDLLTLIAHRHDGEPTVVEGAGFRVGFARTAMEREAQAGSGAFQGFTGWCLDGSLTPAPSETVSAQALAGGSLQGLAALNGGYALVLVDETRGRLYLARDPHGLKPLYWTRSDAGVHFASEIKVLQAMGSPREMSRTGLVEYLCHGVPVAGRTLHPDVRTVRPGTLLQIDIGSARVSVHPFRDPVHDVDASRWKELSSQSEADLVPALEERLRQAVHARLPERRPVGVFLSGGVDSSLTAALARGPRPDLLACTIDVAEPAGISELPYARQAARHLDLELESFTFDVATFRRNLVGTIIAMEHPLVMENAVALYAASRGLAARGVEVMVDGEGADALFAGSTEIFKWDMFLYALRSKSRTLARVAESGLLGIARRLRRKGLQASPPGSDPGLHLLVGGGYFDRQGSLEDASSRLAHLGGDEERRIQALLLNEFSFEMQLLALRLMQTTMAHGIEARLPFLDPNVVRMVINLPMRHKIRVPRWGVRPVTKHLLKTVAERHLPASLLYRPKLGFGIPGGSYVGRLPDAWFEQGALVSLFDLPVGTLRSWYAHERAGRNRFFYASAEIWAQIFVLGRSPAEVEQEYLDANEA